MTSSTYDINILRSFLYYRAETGELVWKERTPDMFSGRRARADCSAWNKRHAGKTAFTSKSSSGYLTSTIMGRRAMSHRVAWCIFYGQEIADDMLIDHINGDKSDNRISNLRVCTAAQNSRNAHLKKSGIRGAFFHKTTKKFQASLRLHLGTYETKEEAAAAYEYAAKILHEEFYLPNGKRPTAYRAR